MQQIQPVQAKHLIAFQLDGLWHASRLFAKVVVEGSLQFWWRCCLGTEVESSLIKLDEVNTCLNIRSTILAFGRGSSCPRLKKASGVFCFASLRLLAGT